MSKSKYMNVLILSIILMMLFLLVNINYLNYLNYNKKESFTTGLNEFYNSNYRYIRLSIESKYNYFKQTISLFFRKIGII
jgi:uncharacterized membrane protein YukC